MTAKQLKRDKAALELTQLVLKLYPAPHSKGQRKRLVHYSKKDWAELDEWLIELRSLRKKALQVLRLYR